MKRFEPTRPLPAGVTLLEASAGTGKTYTIASLVLRLVVEDAVPIDELLVVTFTDAATSELRHRIRRRLREACDVLARAARDEDVTPDDEVLAHLLARGRQAATLPDDARRLAAALESFDTAAICTIHGFCQRVLREHAFECAAEFDAELLEDASDLLEEIVHDFWAREVAQRSPALVRVLLASRCGSSLLLDLARRVTEDPELQLSPAIDDCAAATQPYDPRSRQVAEMWRNERAIITETIADAVERKILSGVKWPPQHRPSWLAAMDEWAASPQSVPPPAVLSRFTRTEVRASANKGKDPPSHAFFEACEDFNAALRQEEIILKHALARYAREEFDKRKRARRQQTFGDLLLLVRDALRDPAQGGPLVERVRGRFRAALIDEFQDTDLVQWEIFGRFFAAPSHRLLLIGDPKQSIYGFRGADVHAYLAARSAAEGNVTSLSVNHRSDKGLVDAVNQLFGRLAAPFGEGTIAYHPVEARHTAPRLVRPGGEVAPAFHVRLLRRAGRLAPAKASDTIDKARLWRELPRHVAADVARTLGEELRIRGGGPGGRSVERPVRPGDIAVLVRSNRNAQQIQQALRAQGVPSVLRQAGSVWESQEARELEAVLGAILEPSNMRLSRNAMATDLLGLAAAAELARSGHAPSPIGAGDALALLDADEARWDLWIDRFRSWGDRWSRRGLMAAFQEMVATLSLPERLLALDDGERRLTNLRQLAELLHAAAVQGPLQPLALLEWMRRQRRRPDGDAESRKLRLESDADAVQIVTVHSSKGLEYPIVFCAYLLDGALARDEDKVHVRFRDVADGEEAWKLEIAPDANGRTHAGEPDVRCFEENLRLMYVALTRARHRCVVYWGNVNEGGSSPLGYLLHTPSETKRAPADCKEERGCVAALSDDAIRVAVEAIASRSAGTIAVSDVTEEPVGRWQPTSDARDGGMLEARPFRRAEPLDRHWRVGSFTALTGDAHREHFEEQVEEPHESLGDAQAFGAAAPTDSDERILLDEFPRSARAGNFFHEVLEHTDFAAPAALPDLVEPRLRAFGFDLARWRRPVVQALTEMFDVPLGDGDTGLHLARLAPADRLTEMRFEFSVCGGLAATPTHAFSASDLARAFRDHPGGAVPDGYADRLEAAGFPPLRGFLQGAIDLVARQRDRWYLVDWKSNHLGSTIDDYAPDRLEGAMVDAHYVLQYHLYTVALHRYLRWRLADYDYERDFGGVYYLFFRGIGRAHGASRGVFHDRPPRARIEALDRVMRAGEALA